MRPLTFMLFPAMALVAQAPAESPNLVRLFNTELPIVNQLLKELKFEEALAKMQALMPAQRLNFDATSPQAIAHSLDNAQGLMSLYRLYANVATENGQWEKALEIQESRAQASRGLLADLDKAQSPLLEQWKKVAQDSADFVAKYAPRQEELAASIKALKEETDAVNAKQKTPDAKGLEELKARIAKNPADQQELDQINQAMPVHKQNVANAPKVFKMLGDNRKEISDMVKAAEEAIAKAKTALAGQNSEITDFNTKQVIARVKIVGKKNWVDAVLRAPENITKLGTPQAQAAFLNRMLVLDPGNAGATKALANLKQGKEPFAKAAKTSTKGAGRKKK